MKTGDNNIHLAAILYSLVAIIILIFVLSALLGKSLLKDFNTIELKT
jgi:hypothetical protein